MTTTEIVSMDAVAARAITDRIKVGVEAVWELIKQAYTERAWESLGYTSWDDYCTREFGTSRLRLPREERAETLPSLRESGMSLRAIATATGLSKDTVQRELAGVSNETPALITGVDGVAQPATKPPRPASEPVGDDGGDVVDQVAAALGVSAEYYRNARYVASVMEDESVDLAMRDLAADQMAKLDAGSTTPETAATIVRNAMYGESATCRDCDGAGCETCFPADDSVSDVIETPADGDAEISDRITEAVNANGPVAAPTPAVQSKPRRRPIEEGFFDATMRLNKAVTSLENLGKDDRLPRNKNQVARYRHDLIRAIDALQRVADQLA